MTLTGLPATILERPANIHAGITMLLSELEDWFSTVQDSHGAGEWQGIHDEGTFLTAWSGYYAYTQDERVLHLALELFGKWREWARSEFVHGYHSQQEVHHGTEHFIIFLDWLLQIAPDYEGVRQSVEDAAHHTGNWAKDAPAWFDWDDCRYLSYQLGTRQVGSERFNFVDHVRLLHLARTGWTASQIPHYLELCENYGGVWAQAIVQGVKLPLYLDTDRHSQTDFRMVLREFLKAAPQDISAHSRLENHIASGTPKIMLELWDLTSRPIFLQAAQRLGRGCAAYVTHSIANPAGHVLSQLLLAGVDPLDLDLVPEMFTELAPWPSLDKQVLAIDISSAPKAKRVVGYRGDMPTHYLQSYAKGSDVLNVPAPANLMLAWTLTGNEEFALDACCLALGKLRLARQVFRDGRHHGCTARSIAATVRGHGRCWGIGDVSGVLAHIGSQRAYAYAQGKAFDYPGLLTN